MFGQTRYKRSIDTPILAGREADGELYLAVGPDMIDLFRDVGRGRHVSKDFSDFLRKVVFADAYTQGGRCCVVDIFAVEEAVRDRVYFPETISGASIYKVRHKLEAVWGQMPQRTPEDETRYQKWMDVPLQRLVRDDTPPLGHWRWTLSGQDQPRYTNQIGWVRRATLRIKDTVEHLYDLRGEEATYENARGERSYMQYLGTQPFLSVADYFVNRGWGG